MTCNCESNIGVGALQRSNPLPPGLYWIDVIDEPHQIEFAAWTFENATKVRIEATEFFDAVSWPDCPITEGECSPSRVWAKFRVTAPVNWNAVALGFPNIIAPGEVVNSSADTATVPDFSDYCDIGCQAEKVAIAAGVLIGGGFLLLLATKFS